MDKIPEMASLLSYAAFVHLRIALTLLDSLRAGTAGAHVNEALEKLKAGFPELQDLPDPLVLRAETDYSILDAMASESYK